MSTELQRIMVDTNVLLDHLLQREKRGKMASRIMRLGADRNVTLLCASLSLKDIAYLTGMMLRRRFPHGESEVENFTSRMLASLLPWRCVEETMELCDVVDVDADVCKAALRLQTRHDDFEDDLIVAAAMKSHASCVVTADAELITHFPDYCMSQERLLESVRS